MLYFAAPCIRGDSPVGVHWAIAWMGEEGSTVRRIGGKGVFEKECFVHSLAKSRRTRHSYRLAYFNTA